MVRATGTPLVQGDWGIGMTVAALANLDMTDVRFNPVPGALVLIDEYPMSTNATVVARQRKAWCGEAVINGPLSACWPLDTLGVRR
jgi:hypothetical protein